MTLYGWDASNHDWDRGPMDLAAARRDGISLFIHKAAEGNGFYEDPYFKQAMDRARTAGFAVCGGYFVNHPGDQVPQADWFVDKVNRDAPWWRSHPCWIWQIDAELFDYYSPHRPPTVAEINAFGDRVVARTGCSPKAVVTYAPQWLYGGALAGLRYTNLWASGYGGNPVAHYRAAAPADNDGRWSAYSGIQPTILQYGSQTTIGSQPICDASAIRVSTEAQLQALFGPTKEWYEMPIPPADLAAIATAVWTAALKDTTGVSGMPHPAQQWMVNTNVRVAAPTELKADLGIDGLAKSADIAALAKIATDTSARVATLQSQVQSLTSQNEALKQQITALQTPALDVSTVLPQISQAAHDGAASGVSGKAITLNGSIA